jgi:glycosyltransferase involved in cell wall biosynthesis
MKTSYLIVLAIRMSRIAVVTSSPPEVEGGHLVIARALERALRDAGHEAEIVVTPDYGFGRQAAQYLATWRTAVQMIQGRRIDRVISLRYPSYAVRHPSHVSWLNHTMREYYDLWQRFAGPLSPRGRMKERVRRTLIHAADRYLLTRNVTKLFVQSRTIQQRLAMWPELRSEVLYPPAPQRPYRCERYGDEFFLASRLTPLKRVELMIRALATSQGRGLRAAIAGEGEDRARLEVLIGQLGVADRVRLLGRIDDRELLDRLGACRAVCFPPMQEDYGFVTVEAFASRKAVVTCHDSGGPAELVEDGVNGFVCTPTPESLAVALRRLADDAALAERMGAAAFGTGRRLSWEETVRRLTA